MQYTGGTTGDAKGVMLSHRNIIANLLQAKAWVGDQLNQHKQETNVTLLPLYHIFSLTVNCLMFMCLGGRNILIANPQDVKRVQMILRKERFNGIAGVNHAVQWLAGKQGVLCTDFSDLRLVIAGAWPHSPPWALEGSDRAADHRRLRANRVLARGEHQPIDISRMREMESPAALVCRCPLPGCVYT